MDEIRDEIEKELDKIDSIENMYDTTVSKRIDALIEENNKHVEDNRKILLANYKTLAEQRKDLSFDESIPTEEIEKILNKYN